MLPASKDVYLDALRASFLCRNEQQCRTVNLCEFDVRPRVDEKLGACDGVALGGTEEWGASVQLRNVGIGGDGEEEGAHCWVNPPPLYGGGAGGDLERCVGI